MQTSQFELAIAIPRDGKSVKIREYGRMGITYVEGRRGQSYSIVFKNNSPNRVMAVVSVDGVDVVDGKPATAESRGYIVNGYAQAEIKGWRTSTTEIRQFFFENKDKSFVAGTVEDTSNCGVIACKVFVEKPKPVTVVMPQHIIEHHHHHYDPYRLVRSDLAYPVTPTYTCCVGEGALMNAPCESKCVTGDIPEFKLGTGWGSAMTDPVALADFERGWELATMAIYYSDAESLNKIGIVLEKELAVSNVLPQGFGGFCQPPKLK
jgi:hypothetical protein